LRTQWARGAILNDDDDAAAVVEISHGDAAALTRATAERFDDERVACTEAAGYP
jgi:hypothetical protein